MKKEANLISSPVLREFYNKAIENKWITEEKIEKTASNMNKYAVSGNLVQDLVALAFGLRELGLFEQAESLETKINLFKKADVGLSNLIDEQSRALQEAAHAENTKIVDAQNGWGVVHTNMDRQRKILETLTHQPQARMENAFKVDLSKAMENSVNPAVKNIALSAADALGLLKLAQATDPERESRIWESTSTEQQKKFAEEINARIVILQARFSSESDILNAITVDSISSVFKTGNLQLPDGIGESALNLYASLAEFTPDDFTNFKNKYNLIKNTCGGVDARSIATWIFGFQSNKDKGKYTSLLSSARGFNISIVSGGQNISFDADTYFKGSVITDVEGKENQQFTDTAQNAAIQNEALKDERWVSNPSSVWMLDAGVVHGNWFGTEASYTIGFDDHELYGPAVTKAADAIASTYQSLYNVFYVNSIKGVSEKINKFIEENIKKPFNDGVNKPIQDLPKKVTVSAVEKLLPNLFAAKDALDKISEFLNKNKSPELKLIKASGINLSISNSTAISEEINFILQRPLQAGDESNINQIQKAINNYNEAQKIYNKSKNLLNSEKDSKTIEQYTSVIAQLNDFVYSLTQVKEKGGTLNQLKEINNTVKSFESLVSDSETTLGIAKDLTGFERGEANDGLFSVAQVFSPNGAKPKGGKAAPGKAAPGKAAPGKAKSDSKYEAAQLTEGQKSVQLMQYALSYLGGFLSTNPATRSDASIIMTVGKTGEDLSSFDAKWKANVAQSLTTAKKYVKDITQVGPDSVFGKNDMLMKSAADDNFNKIIRFLAQQGVQVPGINMAAVKIDYDFDKIPELFGNLDRDKGLIDSTGDIEVKKSHLVSLSAFYNFVNSSMDSFDAEDSTIQEWHDLLTWLWNRSKRKAERFGSTLEKRVFAQYHGFCDALWQKFNRKLQELGIPQDQWSQIVLSPEEFVSLRIKGFGGGAGRAGAEGPEGRRRRRKGRGAGEVEEESDYLGSESEDYDEETAKRSLYPFTKDKIYFNLLDPEGNPWFDLDNFPQFKGTIFFFRGLGDPMTTANKYFRSSKMSPAEVEKHYVQNYLTGLPTESIDERYYYTEVSTGRKQPISRLPEFRKLYPVISSQGQLEEYMKFLTFLLDALDDVAARSKQYVMSASNLSSNKREQVAASLESAHDRWVRELNRSLRNYNRISA